MAVLKDQKYPMKDVLNTMNSLVTNVDKTASSAIAAGVQVANQTE